ncbi:MAG: amidohydrolase [Lachnospiraceae bacterium]|nr:amidohydrolase [Lachnospiraceae bacterium]
MNTIIKNAQILNLNDDGISLKKGEIYIENDTIREVVYHVNNDGCDSNSSNNSSGGSDEGQGVETKVIDACGNVIMPGFKDAHTHSAMTLMRSFADDLPLQNWLNDKIFPLEAHLTEEYVYWGSRLAILEYLTSGITANFDMYMKNDANVKASVDSGFRTVLCGSINNFGGTVADMEQEFLKYNKASNPSQSDLISYKFGFHAEYTTSREILEGMAGLANKYREPIFTHNSETKKEVEECIGRYNMTPTCFFDSLGMFNYGGGLYHCVHMTDDDLKVCKDKNVYVVTNPGSNVKLASGIAPIQKMLDMGINIAIGTDGPASNNCLDMFREMFLMTALQKVSIPDASACDANEVLKSATYVGAKCMHLDDCAEVKAGQKADLIMIDLNQPNMQPIHNIPKNIVYSGSKQNVVMTMVNGKVLYDHGKFDVGVSPEEIYAKAGESIKAMVAKVNG